MLAGAADRWQPSVSAGPGEHLPDLDTVEPKWGLQTVPDESDERERHGVGAGLLPAPVKQPVHRFIRSTSFQVVRSHIPARVK